MFEHLETPRLILDRGRLQRNAGRLLERAREKKVALRPHLKTAKSVDVALLAKDGERSGITVSTLKEAEHFAAHGFSDILYAVGISANKFDRVRAIAERWGEAPLLITDDPGTARQAAAYAETHRCTFDFLVEVDCGEHRGGLPVGSDKIVETARILAQSPGTRLRGVMSHAGHSYATKLREEVAKVAEAERRAAVDSAAMLAEAGFACEIVSVGSTPTVLFAESLDGVTEVRCGIYLFWDLAQYSRDVCSLDDIALSVLSCVIGHNRQGSAIVLDAGALALSRDLGANTHRDDVKYGYVCDAMTLERIGGLSFDVVHQEHGTVTVSDPAVFERLPVGSMVRVLPNHACLTAAPYDSYTVIEDGRTLGEWDRISGW